MKEEDGDHALKALVEGLLLVAYDSHYDAMVREKGFDEGHLRSTQRSRDLEDRAFQMTLGR